MRSQLEKMAVMKEKNRKEESLQNLAKKAREEQQGLRPAPTGGEGEEAQRNVLRADRYVNKLLGDIRAQVRLDHKFCILFSRHLLMMYFSL